MKPAGTTSYALLGLLALRSWTGYELTTQVRRSLRFAWPTSEASLYRDQERLIQRGWAVATVEAVGDRTRKRYEITTAGRQALARWLTTDPAPPSFEVEAIARAWLADQGRPEDLVRSMQVTAAHARTTIDEMLPVLRSYLSPDAPFPERAHVNAIAADLVTELLATVEKRCTEIAEEAGRWSDDDARAEATRRRIQRVLRERGDTPE
jgi:PadR family transcriptional regulator, regulatory protein AphA